MIAALPSSSLTFSSPVHFLGFDEGREQEMDEGNNVISFLGFNNSGWCPDQVTVNCHVAHFFLHILDDRLCFPAGRRCVS